MNMDIGRIFFDTPDNFPTKARCIPLETHVRNVQILAEAWDYQSAFRVPGECDLSLTRKQLIEAARRHDEAKPTTFKIINDSRTYKYSFAGHRFRVPCNDLYTDLLIKMHHEFSLTGITEAQARLRRELGEIGEIYVNNFPLDLYTLEMCDQVAAEVESYAMEGKSDERAFMEMHSRKREDDLIEIEPFPFRKSPLSLSVNFYEYEIPEVVLLSEKAADKLTSMLSEWKPEKSEEQEVKVTICCP